MSSATVVFGALRVNYYFIIEEIQTKLLCSGPNFVKFYDVLSTCYSVPDTDLDSVEGQ